MFRVVDLVDDDVRTRSHGRWGYRRRRRWTSAIDARARRDFRRYLRRLDRSSPKTPSQPSGLWRPGLELPEGMRSDSSLALLFQFAMAILAYACAFRTAASICDALNPCAIHGLKMAGGRRYRLILWSRATISRCFLVVVAVSAVKTSLYDGWSSLSARVRVSKGFNRSQRSPKPLIPPSCGVRSRSL